MIRKATAPLIILLILCIFAVVPPHLFHRFSSDVASDGDAVGATRTADQEPPAFKPAGQRPAHLSSRAWKPADVFAKAGTPSPRRPFLRGENATRRYNEVASRNIDPGLSSQNPAVLAKSPEDGRFSLLPEEIDVHTLTSLQEFASPKCFRVVVITN